MEGGREVITLVDAEFGWDDELCPWLGFSDRYDTKDEWMQYHYILHQLYAQMMEWDECYAEDPLRGQGW